MQLTTLLFSAGAFLSTLVVAAPQPAPLARGLGTGIVAPRERFGYPRRAQRTHRTKPITTTATTSKSTVALPTTTTSKTSVLTTPTSKTSISTSTNSTSSSSISAQSTSSTSTSTKTTSNTLSSAPPSTTLTTSTSSSSTSTPAPTFNAHSSTPSDILAQHNVFRARHGVRPLAWNATLVTVASNPSFQCVFQHQTGTGNGENLALGYPYGTDAVVAWYDEFSSYDYNNPGFSSATGHFTQVVWKGTNTVGCVLQSCSNGQLLRCEYYPPGNYLGQFAQNVFPAGTPVA